jgi:Ni,Fe-hydrogenase III large subunit
MTILSDLLAQGHLAAEHRPRAHADEKNWDAAIGHLAAGQLDLLSVWAEAGMAHMALCENLGNHIGVLTVDCQQACYPSIGSRHPPALRLERAIRDLWGLEPLGLPDRRPWLDHGRWGVLHPLGTPIAATATGGPYEFLASEGESLHQIPVGPVHAGIIEPGHFRFTANGEAVVRLEERLGYVHKGVEGLLTGAELQQGARLAGRVSGDSCVAYALAFSRAAEAALGIEVPPRAHWLRALMAELERLANHFGDIGAICNDASFAIMHAHCGALRERVLRTADGCFGHRLMRDRIVPGGVVHDLDRNGITLVGALVGEVRRRFPALIELYDNTASLQDRMVGTGILQAELARQYAAGGYVGRASGRDFDARRCPGYPPYDTLRFEVPILHEGDVNARVWVRIREIQQSLGLIDQILTHLPPGPIAVVPRRENQSCEGLALVEGFRGDILVWLRFRNDGRIDRCHLRDPSWFQWPLLEAAVEGNIVADFPLCNKSFNCSYSGHDL